MEIETTLAAMQKQAEDSEWSDWAQAFSYAAIIRTATGCSKTPFTLDDVTEILASKEGEKDGPSWIAIGKLSDGRYFFLEAGCDYTGWDCQAGGDAQVADTLEHLFRFGMTEDARKRFEIELPTC